jgi:hypothetical protein
MNFILMLKTLKNCKNVKQQFVLKEAFVTECANFFLLFWINILQDFKRLLTLINIFYLSIIEY